MIDCYYTHNSAYLVDNEGLRYKRLALTAPDRYADTERLSYDEWKPLKSPVTVVRDPFDSFKAPELREPVLHILHTTSERGIFTSPIVWIAYDVDDEYQASLPESIASQR